MTTVLSEDGHAGAVYELAGSRPLTFAGATATSAEATGRDIAYTCITPEDFADYARVTAATAVRNPRSPR